MAHLLPAVSIFGNLNSDNGLEILSCLIGNGYAVRVAKFEDFLNALDSEADTDLDDKPTPPVSPPHVGPVLVDAHFATPDRMQVTNDHYGGNYNPNNSNFSFLDIDLSD